MTFPRYPTYRDSGVAWLGDVPAHWTVTKVRHLVRSLEQGWSPQCDGFPAEGDGEWGVLKVGCVNGGLFRPSENKRLPPDLEPQPGLSLSRGDVLVSRANTRDLVGSAAVVTRDHVRLMLCDKLYRLRLTGDAAPEFLAAYLNSSGVRGQIELSATGASDSMLNITQSAITELHIAAPSVDEQADIAGFLDSETAKIDALVAEQQRLIELLKEKRQAVISQAVMKGLNPDAPTKDSRVEWLGRVPAHWKVLALKRVADVNTGVAKGKDNTGRRTISVPYLRVANVQDGYLDLETVAEIDIPAEELPRYSLKPGDVLMNEGGDYDKLGRGHVWDGQIDPCITQNHVFAVRPRSVSAYWVNTVTGSAYAQFYFMTKSKQSTNLASISSTNLMELPLILPPADEQEAIMAFIAKNTRDCNALTTEARRAIDLLQERRTALISAAVTGQIDVRDGATRSAA